MYYYIAHYMDMDTDEEFTRAINFDGQFFNSELECTVYAVEKAYGLMAKNEMFCGLEFAGC